MKRVASFALMIALCTPLSAQVRPNKNQLTGTKAKPDPTTVIAAGSTKPAQPLNVGLSAGRSDPQARADRAQTRQGPDLHERL